MTAFSEGRIIPAGTQMIFSYGSDSDSFTAGIYRVEHNINRADAKENYEMETRDAGSDFEPSHRGFINWLIKNNFIVQLPTFSWYPGNHGDFFPDVQ